MAGTDKVACVGTGWVEMMTFMCLISIGPNDQVRTIQTNNPTVSFATESHVGNDTLFVKLTHGLHICCRFLGSARRIGKFTIGQASLRWTYVAKCGKLLMPNLHPL